MSLDRYLVSLSYSPIFGNLSKSFRFLSYKFLIFLYIFSLVILSYNPSVQPLDLDSRPPHRVKAFHAMASRQRPLHALLHGHTVSVTCSESNRLWPGLVALAVPKLGLCKDRKSSASDP